MDHPDLSFILPLIAGIVLVSLVVYFIPLIVILRRMGFSGFWVLFTEDGHVLSSVLIGAHGKSGTCGAWTSSCELPFSRAR